MTVPEIGARLTWTFAGDMKIDTLTGSPFSANRGGEASILITFPSAGDNTASAAASLDRVGSRKKAALSRPIIHSSTATGAYPKTQAKMPARVGTTT